jgi:superfamily I DNA and RNA helicase
MAHVINLGAQQILINFKQPFEKDYYEPELSADRMVTAVSRLSFLVRKIRLSPKMRRLMEAICKEKGMTYLVPIIDVKTRWNSTYDMLVRASEYISCLMYFIDINITVISHYCWMRKIGHVLSI